MQPQILLFTSPTCPACPSAKRTLKQFSLTHQEIQTTLYETHMPIGQTLAKKYDIYSVPTFIIQGPAIDHPMGLIGNKSIQTLKKYCDIAVGKKQLEHKKSFWQKTKEVILKKK